MTRTSKAPADATAAAPQLRVCDKNASSYDKQIAFFERIPFGDGRELPLVQAAGFEAVQIERLKASTVERICARKPTIERRAA